MKSKRASLCQGKGSLSHNLRLFTANNVDRSRTKDNVVFVNIPQQEMYERFFDEAVSEYNAKQKRNDRKITVSYNGAVQLYKLAKGKFRKIRDML